MNRVSQSARRDTLQYLMSCDMPSEHKRVLIDALTQVMRNEDTASDEQTATQGLRPWQPPELDQLREFLSNRVARSWQDADEVLTQLAVELQRNPADVRAKARELGLASSIDFAVARSEARNDPQD
jgi:hypothetical protein